MNKISKAVVTRLPRYYRQDLNNFGGFGQQGYGYNVQYLYDEIGKLLGLDVKHKMIIVGAGNLGQAIANYGNFRNRGFEIAALFDKNPDLIGKKTAHGQILDIADIYDYVKKHNVEIVALTLPKGPAKRIAQKLVECGVKAFWNFSDDIIVENVHLSESLMKLTYRISEKNDSKE